MSEETEELRMEKNRGIKTSTHPRYDWLDQFRGMVVVFLVIASLTWELSSDNFALAAPLGPTWLNHGFKFLSKKPEIITIIDLGNQIFMFMLGISLGLSFQSKTQKKGATYAWFTVLHRMLTFIWIDQLIDWLDIISNGGEFPLFRIVALAFWFVITVFGAVFRNLKKYKNTIYRPLTGMLWALASVGLWIIQARYPTPLIGSGYLKAMFFIEPLSLLGWGTLFAALMVYLIKKPDYRIIVSIGFFVVHALLWQFEGVINTGMAFWPNWEIPFDLLGMSAIAIAATCVWDWMNMDPNDHKIGLKKRVIPLVFITGVSHFVIDFFQTADHHGTNVSISLLSIAFSTLLVLVFYSLEFFFKFKVPFLTHLGRNALFLFLFQGIFTVTYPIIWGDAFTFRTQMAGLFGVVDLSHPLVNLMALIAFLVPILVMYFVAWFMDKYHLYIKV